ncbi:MAG: DUF4221 family protein [Sphingobacteriales bacterium]|nr:MAG: DUF4221 family protein [Sphingobacteriales bacterium]
MKVICYFSLSFMMLCFVSCNIANKYKDNYGGIPINDKAQAKYPSLIKFNFDSLKISPEGMIADYGGSNHTATTNREDSALVILQNCVNNTIDMYNLDNLQFHSTYYLPFKENVCGDMSSCVWGQKKIFCLLQNSNLYSMTDSNNYQLITTINNHPRMIHQKLIVSESLDHCNEIFINKDSLLFFPVTNLNHNRNYDFPLTAAYNLITNEISFPGLQYPFIMFKNDYGLLDRIHQYYFESKIIYTFEGLPEIWLYDTKGKTVERFSCKSSYQTDTILPINFKRNPETKDFLWKHFMNSARYERLVYDPFRKCYYRFFILAMPQKNEQGFFNTYKDRRLSVMVLDENFNIIGESLLPEDYYAIFFAVASKQGLLLNLGPLKKATINGFNILKINFATQ